MSQNYQIFINDRPIIITEKEDNFLNTDFQVFHDTSSSILQNAIIQLEQEKADGYIFVSKNPDLTLRALTGFFKVIVAAGGLVINPKNEILMIFRLGKWDLPKGKVELNELIEDSAVREVLEECGIDNLKIKQKLPSTYHTYYYQGKRALKVSNWYLMHSEINNKCIPQEEEGISEVRWVPLNEIESFLENSYSSIKHLLTTELPRIKAFIEAS